MSDTPSTSSVTPPVPASARHQQRRRRISHLVMRAAQPILRPIQEARRSQFDALGTPPAGRIVFLGDSITDGGMWGEWFPDRAVLNRGVGGERSDDVLRRVGSAVNAPAAVFILIGTNDLSTDRRIEDIVDDVAAIIAAIHDRAPGTPVFLQSVTPRKIGFRDDVLALNERYRALAAATQHVTYVDLWPALATPDGTLRPEMTRDGLHPIGPGYRAWAEVLRPIVAQLERRAQQAGAIGDTDDRAPA